MFPYQILEDPEDREERIKESAKGQPCTFQFPSICNYDKRTTEWTTIPQGPVIFGAYACSACAANIDSQRINCSDRVLNGMIKSYKILKEKGLAD